MNIMYADIRRALAQCLAPSHRERKGMKGVACWEESHRPISESLLPTVCGSFG